MNSASASLLPDGRRLHLHHGPIDLIAEGFGTPQEITRCYQLATDRFENALDELVSELPVLRSPLGSVGLNGKIARRMEEAVAAHKDIFVTPMAAVAGAVADEILQTMTHKSKLKRAYVNNGGDISFYLSDGGAFEIGVVSSVYPPTMAGKIRVQASDPVRGIATSGCQGRSQSLGIADAVTVLAHTAAAADVAATLIANAVDLPGHSQIKRTSASEINPDSDLGDRLVTEQVGALSFDEISTALEAGRQVATEMRRKGHINSAVLFLRDECRVVGEGILLENRNQIQQQETRREAVYA